jgi:DNA-binding phage protein
MQIDSKAIRNRCGSAAQMARKVEVTESAIFKMLAGERSPSSQMISRFIKAYSLNPQEVFDFFFKEQN